MIKKITIITLLIVIVGFFVHVNQKTYSTFVDFLPSKVRSNYIEYILDDRAGIGSDYIKILLLQALEREEYEFNIWFTTPRLFLDYWMTHQVINYHLAKLKFNSCLELGPGPGTWTKLLFRHSPEADFDLVDISLHNLGQFCDYSGIISITTRIPV